MGFLNFEHRLLEHLRSEYDFAKFEGGGVCVACSGGADSVALAVALNNLKPLLGFDFKLLHIHHGEVSDKSQNLYRDQAFEFCSELSKKLGVEFLSFKSSEGLKTESECRKFRLSIFEKFEHVFLAHHQNDLMETMLLRLIRGTGLQGLKEPFSSRFHRPFLKTSTKKEIRTYLLDKKQVFVEDPSNTSDDHLRNWLRKKWIDELEKHCGVEGLAGSFKVISEELDMSDSLNIEQIVSWSFTDGARLKSGSLKLSNWLVMSRFQKQSTVAQILLRLLKTGYTKGQVLEIVKSLDKEKKNLDFNCAGLNWSISKGLISFSL